MCADAKAGALLVTSLDEVAWLLNLRGSDVAHNPVFISYVVVTADAASVYLDSSKVGCSAGYCDSSWNLTRAHAMPA